MFGYGEWLLPFLSLSFHGEAQKWPTFWRAEGDFLPGAKGDRVFYERGLNVRGEGLETLARRVLPYFQRTDTHFARISKRRPKKKRMNSPRLWRANASSSANTAKPATSQRATVEKQRCTV